MIHWRQGGVSSEEGDMASSQDHQKTTFVKEVSFELDLGRMDKSQ